MGKRSILIRATFSHFTTYFRMSAITQSNYPEEVDLQQAVINKSFQSGTALLREQKFKQKYQYHQHSIDHHSERRSFGFLTVIYNSHI